ncbi:PcfB family protein [Enterocloster aldensis]|uniref:PcfB family protein n=1 Tax=Enterocloster aldenensis TaxID=358742 RepID=A0ABX2HK31_9FIRM|nr:PcfB family protein [Enterocloster aldenensis]
MQEDIERRTVALSVNASKLTGRALAKVLAAALQQMQKGYQKRQIPQGRQSVKKLMNHGVSTNSLDLSGDTKLFDRMARKYNVDYAFHKTGPDKYLLFFKAGQADAITACFGEYTKLVMGRGKHKRPSILQQLKKFTEKERSKPRQQERKREAVRNER